ncbi:MAG: DJ-1/PfpI family protein [Kofleriaceae bacterium]|nr:DJ-1/PfpI family protein [Kofleriaceae bacterium]
MKDSRIVHVLLNDRFADWEPAFLLVELARQGWQIVTVGVERREIRSMGGLVVVTDVTIADVDPATVRTLLVIGSPLWEQGEVSAVTRFLREVTGAVVAAICGGTLAVAHGGLLAGRRYTSNEPGFVGTHVTGALGTYVDAPAVRDGRVITAGGFAHIEYAAEVLVAIGALPEAEKAGWVGWLRTGAAA